MFEDDKSYQEKIKNNNNNDERANKGNRKYGVSGRVTHIPEM